VTSDGSTLRLNFVTPSQYGGNVGSRSYLMDKEGHYKQFILKNKEFTFTVDVSNLPCGINGALYFSEMKADGHKDEFNPAGAEYGVGYCDAQCPRDLKFIGGTANAEGWVSKDGNGIGKSGSCCMEMDIWEANKISQAYTVHPCTNDEEKTCTGKDCEELCDKGGCDFGTWRLGNHTFYGPGDSFDINTEQPFQVIT